MRWRLYYANRQWQRHLEQPESGHRNRKYGWGGDRHFKRKYNDKLYYNMWDYRCSGNGESKSGLASLDGNSMGPAVP